MRKNESMKPAGNTAETALTLSHEIVGQVMTPADFTALDGLINKLGDRSTALAPDEREAAAKIVDDWNESVTQSISENAARAGDVLAFLDGKRMYGRMLDDIVEMFHGVLGDTAGYTGYVEATESYNAVQADVPMEIPVEDNMTVKQVDEVSMANRAAQLAYDRKLKSAEYRYARAVKAYITEINAMPDIKSVRANLSSYRRKANRMACECKDKATRAKLNITISDPATRDLLREMMDFTKKI